VRIGVVLTSHGTLSGEIRWISKRYAIVVTGILDVDIDTACILQLPSFGTEVGLGHLSKHETEFHCMSAETAMTHVRSPFSRGGEDWLR
tara:strand:+ start:37858 stop:38124 length:267 start_codon:yes stop_codon:yes gene_type:complete